MMMNHIVIEGVLVEKPVLLEGKEGAVTEFNLKHSDLSGPEAVWYSWRCKAEGALAKQIAECGCKGQTAFLQGKLIQELVSNGGQKLAVVKLLVVGVRLTPMIRGV